MEYKEQINNLTKEQRLELLVKFANDLGFKRVRCEQKRNKYIFRFEKSAVLSESKVRR